MKPPVVSVILPTRNRPQLFERALQSVRNQTGVDLELLIVVDGQSDEFAGQYAKIFATLDTNEHLIQLGSTFNGHRPAYVHNRGIEAAKGDYIAFLDDDDEWIDSTYLETAARLLNDDPQMDSVYFDQEAVRDGEILDRPIWLEGDSNDEKLTVLDADKVFVTGRFAHCNTSVLRRDFCLLLQGRDESFNYEVDRDFFYRSIDITRKSGHFSRVVARHYVPDSNKTDNASTQINKIVRLEFQLRIFNKHIIEARLPSLRNFAMMQRRYILKHLALSLYQEGKRREARYYAAAASAGALAVKWRLVQLAMRFSLPL